MQYQQESFSVYMGTEKYRSNYDKITWSRSSTVEHPPVQREAEGSAPSAIATEE